MTQRGQMLVVVLWVMGLLSLAAGAVVSRATHELRLGRVPLASLQREAIAQAGVQQAAAYLAHDNPDVDHLGELWATGVDLATNTSVFEQVPVGEGWFSIGARTDEAFVPGLVDEERKLNLNHATAGQLSRLVAAVNTGEPEVNQLVTAIVDWLDEPAGPVCGQEGMHCHNGLFTTVDELRLVPGMTPELFTTLKPHVTVYGTGAINVNTASALVLNALDCDGDRLVRERQTQPEHHFTSPPADCPATVVSSSVFAVPVEAEVAHASGRMRLLAIIDREGHLLNFLIDTR